MTETEKAILKTIACYEALGQYPLTVLEIYRYLQKESPTSKPPKFLEIISLLQKSQALDGYLQNQNGFFFFKGKEDLYNKRIYRYKISSLKWKKIRRISVFLSLVPFFRGVAINGSLAVDNARTESDIDFLVFTKKGRIWTCRMFLGFFLQIIGQRRHDTAIADRICLNHYIAEPSFLIPIKNTPNAQLYCRLKPLINYGDWQFFLKDNLPWIKDFLFFQPLPKERYFRRINEESAVYKFAWRLGIFFEFILELAGAQTAEKALGNWQKKRIKSKISQRPTGQDELFLDDSMLVFHYPICKNREVLKAYAERINSLK